MLPEGSHRCTERLAPIIVDRFAATQCTSTAFGVPSTAFAVRQPRAQSLCISARLLDKVPLLPAEKGLCHAHVVKAVLARGGRGAPSATQVRAAVDVRADLELLRRRYR